MWKDRGVGLDGLVFDPLRMRQGVEDTGEVAAALGHAHSVFVHLAPCGLVLGDLPQAHEYVRGLTAHHTEYVDEIAHHRRNAENISELGMITITGFAGTEETNAAHLGGTTDAGEHSREQSSRGGVFGGGVFGGGV